MVTLLPRLVSGTPPPERTKVPCRWLVLGGIASLMIGAYLLAPSLARFDADTPPRFSAAAAVTVPSYGARGTHILAYAYGEQFTITVPIANRGVVPVTVTELRLTEKPRPLVETASVTVDGDRLPATLWPGETAVVELRARFDNCRYYHEREMQTMPGAVVSGHVLGRPVTAIAEFDRDLVVASPMIVGCPDRTLVRGDDIRR